MIIRSLDHRALPDMADLMQRSYRESINTGGKPWSVAQLSAQLLQDNSTALGMTDEPSGQLHGFVLFRQIFDEAEILVLAVDPNRQRKGFGYHLMSATLEQLSSHSCQSLFLEVSVSNAPAISLYQKLGLRITGRRPGYYQGLDALIMAKTF